MTRKQRRLYFVLLGMLALGAAVALVLTAISDSLVYFHSPTDIATKDIPAGRRLRVGGLVEPGSVAREGAVISFKVTDNAHTLAVVYTGVLPDLFREGQGVVAEGRMEKDGIFHAADVLAKHDENYMPKEVADALKQGGHWQGEQKK